MRAARAHETTHLRPARLPAPASSFAAHRRRLGAAKLGIIRDAVRHYLAGNVHPRYTLASTA